MEKIKLFSYLDSNGEEKIVTNYDMLEALKKISADKCELLFIHTDISSFGMPNRNLKKKKLLSAVYEVIKKLGVDTIVFPAFTFSFANGEAFDLNKSSAKYMGALNEYVRKMPDSIRSMDPLMSVVAVGKRANEFAEVGKSCMGEDGMFSLLHKIPNVKFLFLGAKPTHCFTYAHYVEAVQNVPYRFEKWYKGIVIDENGNERQYNAALHAACKGIYPAAMTPFEKHMKRNDGYDQIKLGSGIITCFSEKDAYQAMLDALDENIYGFLQKPFVESDLVNEVKDHGDQRIVQVP